MLHLKGLTCCTGDTWTGSKLENIGDEPVALRGLKGGKPVDLEHDAASSHGQATLSWNLWQCTQTPLGTL